MRGVSVLVVLALVGVFGLGIAASASDAAGNQAKAKYGSYRYRVIVASHSSSSEKDDPPFYKGKSTSTWKLARATKRAPNVIGINKNPSFITGLGQINVRGVYTADATTNWNGGTQCHLSAPTGSQDYPATAPGDFMFGIGPHPSINGRLLAAWSLGMAIYASLGNGYFGTECSTSLTGEPDIDDTHGVIVPKSVIGKNRITIRSRGSSVDHGIKYSWTTTFVLKKIVKKKRR
ncbi:MAG: hypothetical protein M3R70_12655 [Actinomycetota bacterium]|nr:hypothetical protein [Actinomycetota bacterium]